MNLWKSWAVIFISLTPLNNGDTIVRGIGDSEEYKIQIEQTFLTLLQFFSPLIYLDVFGYRLF